MSAQEIVEVVGELIPGRGTVLERQHGPQALAAAREIETALVPRLEGDPAYAPLWQQFRAAPQTMAPALAGVLQVLLVADAALAQRLDELLAEYQRATAPTGMATHTGGGAYIGGDVKVGGDFVGRDKTEIRITGDGNVVGDRSSATVVKRAGADVDQVAALFERALELARAPQRPPEEREDLEAAVEMARQETEKGQDADHSLLDKALDVLLERGPDILEVVLEAILNPAAAAGKGARMLARQAKKSLASRRRRPHGKSVARNASARFGKPDE
jgi:hypothetical protein